jgi:hypothetical protein
MERVLPSGPSSREVARRAIVPPPQELPEPSSKEGRTLIRPAMARTMPRPGVAIPSHLGLPMVIASTRRIGVRRSLFHRRARRNAGDAPIPPASPLESGLQPVPPPQDLQRRRTLIRPAMARTMPRPGVAIPSHLGLPMVIASTRRIGVRRSLFHRRARRNAGDAPIPLPPRWSPGFSPSHHRRISKEG